MEQYSLEDLNLITARLKEFAGSESILVLCFGSGKILKESRNHGLNTWGLCFNPDHTKASHPWCLPWDEVDNEKSSFKWGLCLEAPDKTLMWEKILSRLQDLEVENFLVHLSLFESWDEVSARQLIESLISNGFIRHLTAEGMARPLFWYSKGLEREGADQVLEYEYAIAHSQLLARQENKLLLEYHMELMKSESEHAQSVEQLDQLETELSRVVQLLEQREFELSQIVQQLAQRENELSQAIHQYESFWASRTGKTLLALQTIKKGLGFSRMINGVKAMIHQLPRGIALIKREGLLQSARILQSRLARFLRVSWAKYKLRMSPTADKGEFLQIEAIQPGFFPGQHIKDVDIIICVHNALEDVKRCLDSVLEYSSPPYKIILVDDGSGSETAQFLRRFTSRNSEKVTLIRNEVAKGYTFAANSGIRSSSSDYALLLNSDTIVSPRWLDQLVGCAESDEKIGMVGPLSNTASWQSIPRVEENGDWASNPLPTGISNEQMGRLVSKYSGRIYPRIPLLNGFCILIKRKMLSEVGLFDEENFGQGYGEEDDLVLRARKKGWEVALADDTYIYHAQARSYTDKKRKALSKRAGKILVAKHGTTLVEEGVRYCLESRVLNGIRARAQVLIEREKLIAQGKDYSGKRILFLLPVEASGGGANIAVLESLAMKKMGVDVGIFNLPSYRDGFLRNYPDLQIPVIFSEPSVLPEISQEYDAIIATHNATVAWMAPLRKHNPELQLGYYIQGFEPLMYETGTSGYQNALASYDLIPDMVRFTKTHWTRDQVLKNTGMDSHVIGISVDMDLFRPRPTPYRENPNLPIRIAAMIRPESPYREPKKTMQLLKLAHEKYNSLVEVVVFGTQPDNPGFLELPIEFPWKLYGTLPSQKVASLVNTAEIFIDYSSHQAMGLTALEAMAVGCAVVVPEYGGAVSYCHHMQNGLVVDTSDFDKVWQALQLLIEDDKLRNRLQKQAIYDVCQYQPEGTSLRILQALWAS